MFKKLLLMLSCIAATQAREVTIENRSSSDLHVRLKVELTHKGHVKRGSVHADVLSGQSATVDLSKASKWVRSTTECDTKRSDKGAKIYKENIAPATGLIDSIKLVKIKAVGINNTSIRGRAKVLGKSKDKKEEIVMRKDLVNAPYITIAQRGTSLAFNEHTNLCSCCCPCIGANCEKS